MRVLLSGGKKTQNIIDGISKRFTTSGDEFLVIEYLEDIVGIFSRGDYFDKAVITEQSITRDGAITDEMQIRRRVNDFATTMSNRPHKYNYVFLAQTEEIANMIYEEILPIFDESAVVFKKPKYNVTFFVDLIVTEAKDLPSDWVYEPAVNIPDSDDFITADIAGNDFGNNQVDTSDMDASMELQDMPADDIFGDSWGNGDGFGGENGLNFDLGDQGQGNSFGGDIEEDGFAIDENGNVIDDFQGDTQGFGNQFGEGFGNTSTDGVELSADDFGSGDFNGDLGDNDFGGDFNGDFGGEISGDNGFNSFENDEVLDQDNMKAIKQSGDLPDYSEPVDNEFGAEDNDNYNDEGLFGDADLAAGVAGVMAGEAMSNTSDIFGQDGQYDNDQMGSDDFGNDQIGSNDFGNDQYGNDMSNNFDNGNYDNTGFDNGNYDNTGFNNDEYNNDGFDNGNYDNYDNPQQGGNNMVSNDGFDNSMYDNGNTMNDNNSDNDGGFDNSMYDNAYQNDGNSNGGFDNSMYDNNEQDNYQNNIENNMYGDQSGFDQSMYNSGMDTAPKKGLKGLLSKKKGNKYQDVSGLNSPQPVQGWEQDIQQELKHTGKSEGVNVNSIKKQLKPFAARGNSIVVTGCGGCGTSTIAYNLANIVHQLGYSVLLVDMDTEGRTQSYISKTNYDSMEPDGANLMAAVNSSTGTGAQEAIVKQGFHLLTMGLGTDTAQVSELLHKEKISRFVNLVKSSHDFVIYDIPFRSATDYLSEITYTADNLVLVTDASNWGIAKLMLSVCNISADDMQDTIFNRAQLVFNKYRNLTKVFGRKVRTGIDITKIIDMKVQELIGEDPGFHFEDLHIAGILNDDPEFEKYWFEKVQYSDTQVGQAVFLELLEHIVLKK
jgi:cellulose biosynthesis protein BcsQ